MPRPSNPVLLAVLLLCGSMMHAGNSQANVPGWMKDLASQPVGTYPPRTDAVVLLDETTVSVTNPSEYTQTNRRVVRILRPEGRSEGSFEIYLSAGDKKLNAHAWSIDASGHQYEVKEKEFLEVSPFGGIELYSDDRRFGANVAAPDPGSIVAIEYTVRRKAWISELRWWFQENIPVKEARYVLELPQGWEYKTAWANATPKEPTQLAPNKWQWVQQNVPGIVPEKLRPSHEALAGRMLISYFAPGSNAPTAASWRSIGVWYNGLTSDRRNATPEITEKARQLTAGASTFDARLRALARFLQTDIRYVAISIGIGGFQPHYASDIYQHRYGDCKDKVTLLSSMLQLVGIRSHYVLVTNYHGAVDPNLPSTAFNHAILAIELPDGPTGYASVVTAQNGRRYLIFDPTDEQSPVGEIGAELQGNTALLMTEAGGEAIRLPLLDPARNVLERTGKFILSADGGLAGEVTEKRTGDNADNMRHGLKNSSEAERTQYLERFFGNFLNGMSLQTSKIENLSDLDRDLILHYKISASKYAQLSGSLFLVRPRVLGQKGVTLDWKDRKYPVDLDATARHLDTFEIQLPEGFVVDDVPESTDIDVGFASYKSRIEVAGSTIRYYREYVVKDPQVPLAKLADLKRLQQEIGRDEFASIVLKKK